MTVVVGADQALEERRQFDPLQLQRQRVAVGVGDQHGALAGQAQGGEEVVGVRAQGDQVRHLALEVAHRQLQLAAPEVQAVPAELAGMVAEQRFQLGVGQSAADAVVLGVALRQVLQPEVVVEMQVEQGAVHVEQDGIDLGPGQAWHGRLAGGMSRLAGSE
ncbi:hypothetical protein D3C76_1119560 [compost metagenome]